MIIPVWIDRKQKVQCLSTHVTFFIIVIIHFKETKGEHAYFSSWFHRILVHHGMEEMVEGT